MSPSQVLTIGERVIDLERAFNVREGITRKDDILPERFLKEPLPKECGASAGSVVELEPMLEEYYHVRGWHPETGIPTDETFEKSNLKYVEEQFRKRGKIY